MVEPVQNPPPVPDEALQEKPTGKARMKPRISRAGFLVAVIMWTFTSYGCPHFRPAFNPIVEATKVGEDYSVDFGNGLTLDMIWIPEGTFLMGSPSDEPGRLDDEGPQTNVSLKGFWMGKFEVTQAQYKAVMGENPSWFKGDNNPVEMVSWSDAMEFCGKLSEKSGQNYTLPTEAQWEYTCRAGTTTAYSFGDDASQLGNCAWWGRNSSSTTHPVGGKKGNAWGLYDMNGNVFEWCLSWYKNYPYSETDGRNDITDTSVNCRVLRGGSWNNGYPDYFRCADRPIYYPDDRYSHRGFRCARTL